METSDRENDVERIMHRLRRFRLLFRNINENNNEVIADSTASNRDSYADQQRGTQAQRNSISSQPEPIDTNQGNSDNNGFRFEEISGSDDQKYHLIAVKAMSREGSQIIQERLKQDCAKELRVLIFESISRYLAYVMRNEFGFRVFTKLIERCDHDQLRSIVGKLTEDNALFVDVLRNRFGASSVMMLIKALEKSPLVRVIMSFLVKKFNELMANRWSSSVILKCFQVLDDSQNKELYEAVVINCIGLATDEKACIALNESIKYMKRPYRDQVLDIISSQARFLSQDPSGNYVMQQVLKLHNPLCNERILSSLKGSFVDFCTQKVSSHVVEKCLECDLGIYYVVPELLKCDKLWQIAKNQYGNYVIQKALKLAAESYKNRQLFIELVKKLYRDREYFKNGYGTNVYSMIMYHMYQIEGAPSRD